MEARCIVCFLILLLSFPAKSQDTYKAYIKYFTTASYRNSEGDLIVKNNGDYFSAWTQFRNGTDDNSSADIAAAYSQDSGKNWIHLGIIQENLGLETTISVSLIRINSTTVHMYFCVGNSHTDLQVYRKVSTDDCLTWGAAEHIINDPGYSAVLNGQVRRVSSGRIIMAIYTSLDVNNIPPDYLYVYTWYSDDDGETWTRSTPNLTLAEDIGYAEPGFFEPSNGAIKLNMRVQSGGFQVFSQSNDNSETYNTPFTSTLSSTGSPAAIWRLSNGVIVAFHNPTDRPFADIRSTLRMSKSIDGGATWITVNALDEVSNDYNFAYPSITEHDGRILVTYWETNKTVGKIALKFASIPINNLN